MRGAQKLAASNPSADILKKVDSGIVRTYKQSTGEIMSVNKDGTIRIYFKATDGINYWNKQRGQ